MCDSSTQVIPTLTRGFVERLRLLAQVLLELDVAVLAEGGEDAQDLHLDVDIAGGEEGVDEVLLQEDTHGHRLK